MIKTSDLHSQSKARANEWLASSIDEESKKQVEALLAREDPKLLIDSFYKTLEFGTGGLRGLMGVGSNCIKHFRSVSVHPAKGARGRSLS